MPTARAAQLAEPIAEVLARVRSVISGAGAVRSGDVDAPLHIAAPDGISGGDPASAAGAPASQAPGIDIGLRQLLPPQAAFDERAWEPALTDLECGAMDIAVAPLDSVPARFVARTLYEEDFVVVARARHPFAQKPTLDRFCRSGTWSCR